MPALLYILLCAAFGIALVSLLVPDVRRLYLACAPSKKIIDRIPNSLFIVPSGIILGIMCVPFLNYYITLGLSYFISNHDLCLKGGIILTAALILWIILSCVILIAKRRSVREAGQAGAADDDPFSQRLDPPLTGQEAQQLRELIAAVEHTTLVDEKAMSIIREEAAAFLAGQRSAEETARLIQSRVSLYVSEQA